MAVNKRNAEAVRLTQVLTGRGRQSAYAKRLLEYCARAERMKEKLRGRKHSDSAKLVAEDRLR